MNTGTRIISADWKFTIGRWGVNLRWWHDRCMFCCEWWSELALDPTDNRIQPLDAEVCTASVLQKVGEWYAMGKTNSHLLLGNIYHYLLCEHYFHICGMRSLQSLLESGSISRWAPVWSGSDNKTLLIYLGRKMHRSYRSVVCRWHPQYLHGSAAHSTPRPNPSPSTLEFSKVSRPHFFIMCFSHEFTENFNWGSSSA